MTMKAGRVPYYMVALTYLPLLLLLAGALVAGRFSSLPGMTTAFLLWLYLIPPLLCRVVMWLNGAPITDAAGPEERVFKLWWLLTQLQMPFNRIGLLEEVLRLVPGLYSLWLNLWGSKVSLMTYWTRDILISERYLLTIEPGVTLASQTGISGHLVTPDADGNMCLMVQPVVIERGAMLGIRSGLGPGCRLYAGELLPAGRLLAPGHGWRNGRKVKLSGS